MCCFPLELKRQPSRCQNFEAQSHSLFSRCLRLATTITGSHPRLATGGWLDLTRQAFHLLDYSPLSGRTIPICKIHFMFHLLTLWTRSIPRFQLGQSRFVKHFLIFHLLVLRTRSIPRFARSMPVSISSLHFHTLFYHILPNTTLYFFICNSRRTVRYMDYSTFSEAILYD